MEDSNMLSHSAAHPIALYGLVSKEGRNLCLNDFPQGISIFTITREIRYLKCLSFVRQEGDWAFVVCGLPALRRQ